MKQEMEDLRTEMGGERSERDEMHVFVSEDEKGLPGPNSQSIWGP